MHGSNLFRAVQAMFVVIQGSRMLGMCATATKINAPALPVPHTALRDMEQFSHDIRELIHLLREMHFVHHKIKCCVAKKYRKHSYGVFLQSERCNEVP